MFSLLEDYLDKEEKFWDYKTKNFDGKNPFDITKGESGFVKQLLNDPDYMRDYKNLIATIEYLSPKEYFEECAKIFDSTTQIQIDQIKHDTNTIEKLKQVLFTYKKTFPITYLNYAYKGQEGRHRMYVVGELFGWNKKYPVLIINWADLNKVNKEKEQEEEARKENIKFNIEKIIDKIKSFTFISVDDIIEELVLRFNCYYNNEDINIKQEAYNLIIKIQDVVYKVSIYEFDIEDDFIDYDDIDIDDIDLSDLSWIHK